MEPQLEHLLNRLEDKIDRIHTRLDAYSERVTKVETDLEWIKKWSRFSLRIGIGAASSVLSMLIAFFYEHLR